MSDDEIFVLIVSAMLCFVGIGATHTSRLPPMMLRRSAGLGLVRVAVAFAMAWIFFVLLFFADPSVTAIYVAFYLVMGYAVVKVFGQCFSSLFNIRFRIDVAERGNLAAAWFVAAFVVGTGLIFGGSLWGEADPDGDGEGGWWIPFGFFLSGWFSLLAATGLYLWREPGPTRRMIRQDRRIADARSAAFYILGSAMVLAEAVAGDFHGWIDGLLAVAAISGMLITHEIFLIATRRVVGDEGTPAQARGNRILEGLSYLGWAALSWFAGRWVLRILVA
ncbi:MAG: hypothetical protein EA425_12195 [Puniceicoccaceae bacterium]|nr:MAG: hypothetical protein EA425_12195 [Puniceicoccaceae bacterium]